MKGSLGCLGRVRPNFGPRKVERAEGGERFFIIQFADWREEWETDYKQKTV